MTHTFHSPCRRRGYDRSAMQAAGERRGTDCGNRRAPRRNLQLTAFEEALVTRDGPDRVRAGRAAAV